MTKQEKQFVKAVMLGLAALLPGGTAVKGLADPLLEQLLKEEKDSSIARAAAEKVQDLCKHFHAAEEAGVVNQGTGYAAAADFAEIVRKASITPRLLVDLQLDPQRLAAHLKTVGDEELREASQGRRGLVLNGIVSFADAVIEIAPQSSGVQLEFMRSVLRNIAPLSSR